MSLILAIESSCDETACAVVKDGVEVISHTLASSSEMHMKWGGVIPEIAARKQLESVVPVIDSCMEKAKENGVTKEDLTSIAVTAGPGLIGSLVIGIAAAKSLALAWNKPLIPVNHLVGHIYANFIQELDGTKLQDGRVPEFPAMVMIVSGGHTDIVVMKSHGEFEYIGGTVDDAAGEAFDKAARLLGISPYLGGVRLSQKANEYKNSELFGKSVTHLFKRPMIDSGDYDFSFSGIKTAVLMKVKEELGIDVKTSFSSSQIKSEDLSQGFVKMISYEFEEAVTDVLSEKLVNASFEYKVKSILLGGGVSANSVLREKVAQKIERVGFDHKPELFVPPTQLCTDNAIYIASCAHFNNNPKPLEKIDVMPGLTVMDRF